METEYVGNKRSTPGKLVMTNTGSGSLAISGSVVAVLNSTNFPFIDNCQASLAAGASCTLIFISNLRREALALAK
jgi:hypothetical protein